jgi:hypothetical protein
MTFFHRSGKHLSCGIISPTAFAVGFLRSIFSVFKSLQRREDLCWSFSVSVGFSDLNRERLKLLWEVVSGHSVAVW